MRGHSKDTRWPYTQKNTQLCTHQGTNPPPQAFKHCLATMRARGRKQGSLARDNNLASMYSTPTHVRGEHRGYSVCESSEAEAESNSDEGEGQHTRQRVGAVGRFLIVRTQSRLVVLTPVVRSIFQPLSHTHISKSEFKNEISSSALPDIQMTLFCVCGVDSFLPELEHL